MNAAPVARTARAVWVSLAFRPPTQFNEGLLAPTGRRRRLPTFQENRMDKKLQRLETHRLAGDDGQAYVVHGYEHLTRLDGTPDGVDQWEPTGQFEYKLADGTPLQVHADGSMTISRSGVRLAPVRSAEPA